MSFASAFKEYTQGLGDIQIMRYTQLTSSCIIIFEHLITLDEEVDLIWRSSWSLGKALFLLNRYYALAASIFNNYALFYPNPTDAFCLRYVQWQGCTGLIGCMLAEGILQIRLYALYSLNKKILALMLTTFFLCSTISAYILFSVLSSVTASAFPIPGGKFCILRGVSHHFYAFWIPILFFEALLCTLAIIRGVQKYRSQGNLFRSGRQLVGILVRDSLMYFLIICSTYMTCLLMWAVASVNLLGVPIGFSLAMSCVLANRVVLNVREINRDLNLSRQPLEPSHKSDLYDVSFCSPGELSRYEMHKLRSLRAERNWSEIAECCPQSATSY